MLYVNTDYKEKGITREGQTTKTVGIIQQSQKTSNGNKQPADLQKHV